MGAIRLRRMEMVLGFVGALFEASCSSGPISVGDHRVLLVSDSGPDAELDSGFDSGRAVDASFESAVADANEAGDASTIGGLVGVTGACANPISTGLLQPRPSRPASVQICQLSSAIFWKSGLAVLCSGKSTTICNSMTDPGFQQYTTALDSLGGFLDAAALPYVEVSAASMNFDWKAAGLKMGNVVAVVYNDHLEYGILGTVGVQDIIGDASYKMADSLGMNPDPMVGGAGSGVTYVAFPSVSVTKNEDHDEAVRLGQAAAAALIRAGK
jgi:Fungal chitosanase of glycosyl hydrolase group 75